MTDFSEILTQLRDWGVNDYDLADLTGVNRTTLTKLRAGTRKQPNYDDGCAIMAAYKKEERRQKRK